jgi:predicted 3-demethylubiquinone-9 3-methyltransferase (glyoxalase superfamily)
MNAGPHFKFSEAISLYVDCSDQEEVDYYWKARTTGAARKAGAAGSRTDMGFPGKSFSAIPS